MSDNCTFSQIYISEELILQILYRLPAKSLLRFMSVCKLWRSLIKNPNFISSHFNHHINQEPRYLLYCDSEKHDQYYVHKDIDTFDRHLEFNLSYPNTLKIVGCCNGIVCFVDKRIDTSLVLWNYSLRKSLDIEVPHCNVSGSNEKSFHWFGFDVISNDYKLVWVGYMDDTWENNEIRILVVYIYSIKERTWKCVKSSFVLYDVFWSELGGVYINGVIHWEFWGYGEYRGVPLLILKFNLEDETFGVFNVPSEIVDENELNIRYKQPRLGERIYLRTVKKGCKDCLVILHDEGWTKLSMWVMEEDGIVNSWTEDFDMQLKWYIKTILNVEMNGEIVMQRDRWGVISLDHRHMMVKLLFTEYMDYVGTYMESLVFL